MDNQRQRIELADIFSNHAKTFLQHHRLCPEQQKAFEAIIRCRTAALGGHMDRCDSCGHIRPSYNSCRNRNCPKCQFVKKVQWVDKLAANLPPVKHFHIVFTIPQCLHQLFMLNQEKAYGLLFRAGGKALMQCAANPQFLGAQVGATAILHTWGQTLVYHPHLHMIVPAGGLSEDQMEWISCGRNFFLPVKALSRVFRGLLCRLIEEKITSNEICLPDAVRDFRTLKNECYKKNWVVYCEKPFNGPDSLIQYLGNYTHRVAITNHRLQQYENGKVSFCYKDYKSAGERRSISLDADEFIRRFMQHVLPCGFYKIRYFGFMAMCNVKEKLAKCFELIDKLAFLPVLEGLTALEVWRSITGIDPLLCPKCKAATMKPLPIAAADNLKTG